MKIIGGVFPIEDKVSDYDKIPWFLKDSLEFINGRSAFVYLCNLLRPENIWLPSYVPDFLVDCLKDFRVNFYGLDEKLNIISYDWIDKIKENDMILFINYFGFSIDKECAKIVKDKRVIIVEDACQALLSSHIGSLSNYVIFSLRKVFGIPDGGLLFSKNLSFEKLKNRQNEWINKRLDLLTLRKNLENKVENYKKISEINNQLESEVPIEFNGISDVSKLILDTGIDYFNIITRRLNNYSILYENFKNISLYKIDEETVPYGFPIIIKNRDKVKNDLMKVGIDCDIHWKMKKVPKTFKESYNLSKHILTIPCDHRYNEKDMDYIIEKLKMILKGKHDRAIKSR